MALAKVREGNSEERDYGRGRGRLSCCNRPARTDGTEYDSLAFFACGTGIDRLRGWEINLYHRQDNATNRRVLLFSGNATVLNDTAQLETCEILPNPVHPEALLKKIHEVLDSTQPSASPSLADQTSAPQWPVPKFIPPGSVV